jgi:hypothetical protein
VQYSQQDLTLADLDNSNHSSQNNMIFKNPQVSYEEEPKKSKHKQKPGKGRGKGRGDKSKGKKSRKIQKQNKNHRVQGKTVNKSKQLKKGGSRNYRRQKRKYTAKLQYSH